MNDPKELLVKIFGQDMVDRHIAVMQYCKYVHVRLPKHVTFEKVVSQVTENRKYILIGGLIFVHQSRLKMLADYLKDGSSEVLLKETRKAIKSLPTKASAK